MKELGVSDVDPKIDGDAFNLIQNWEVLGKDGLYLKLENI